MKSESGYVKRPLALIGLTFFLTVWSLTTFGYSLIAIILPLLFSAVGLTMILKYKKRAIILVMTFVTFMSACLCFFVADRNLKNASDFCGKDRIIKGSVYDYYEGFDGIVCEIKADSIDGIETDFKIKVTFPHLKPDVIVKYENISFTADLTKFDDYKDSYNRNSISEKIYLSGKSEINQFEKIRNQQHTPMYYINLLREKICNAVIKFLPNDYGGLILSFVLGEKSYLSKQVIQNFKICGISHLMAVSGLHVYTWSSYLYTFLTNYLTRRKSSLIAICFTLFFMALTGFSPSVVRAGIMMICVYAGHIFFKQSDSLNSLGLAALILLIINPFASTNISFMLSFSAALGLAAFGERISKTTQKAEEKFKNKIVKKLSELITSSISTCFVATVFTLPIMVFYLGNFSLLNFAGNLVAVNISMYIMIIGGIGAILSAIIGLLGQPFLFVAGFLSKILLKAINFLAQFDFLYFNVDNSYVKTLIVVFAISLIGLYIYKPEIYKNKKVTAFIFINLFVISFVVEYIIKCLGVI